MMNGFIKMPLGTDSALGQLAHPFLFSSQVPAFPSLVTIEAATETTAGDYSVTETWAAVGGLIEVPGILAPAGAAEIRTAALTNVKITHVCDLQSYCPEITTQHRATVTRADFDGAEVFNITAVKHDSQAAATRLELEKVSH